MSSVKAQQEFFSFRSPATILVAVISGILWFSLLGYRDLIEPDEARYAEIPREMVASGDWLTPHLNGYKYFEKPALQYWMTALSFEAFGESNASARLWLTIAGFLCALSVGYLGCRLYGNKTGFYTFLIAQSSFLFTAMGHVLTLDMSLTLFMTVGVCCLVLAQQAKDDGHQNRNWMLLGWAALAAAVLTKGLEGIVLPGLAVFLYMLWQRDWAILKRLHLAKGMLLFLLLTAPWFFAVSYHNPEFAHFFFIREHLERYTTTVHNRDQPIFYFVPILLLGVSPWLVVSLRGLFKPAFKWKPANDEGFNPERLIWIYIVSIFVFFSTSDSMLAPYILPILPFVALQAAYHVNQSGKVIGDGWTSIILAIVFLGVAIFMTRFANEKMPAELYQHYQGWVIAGAIVLAAGGLSLFKWREKPSVSVPVASLCAVLCFQLLLWGFQAFSVSRSAADEAAAINSKLPSTATVYSLRDYSQALPFYLGRTVTLVETKGELEMGIRAEPDKWIPTLDDFILRWNKEHEAAAIMGPDVYTALKEKSLPMNVIHTGPRWVVVTR